MTSSWSFFFSARLFPSFFLFLFLSCSVPLLFILLHLVYVSFILLCVWTSLRFFAPLFSYLSLLYLYETKDCNVDLSWRFLGEILGLRGGGGGRRGEFRCTHFLRSKVPWARRYGRESKREGKVHKGALCAVSMYSVIVTNLGTGSVIVPLL